MTFVERLLGRFLRVHDAVYQKTNGRIGRRLPGFAPALLLHTVGAKTGQPRTTSLSYSNDGNDYLIVASKGGDPGRRAGTSTSRSSPTSKSTSAQGVSPRRRTSSCPPTRTTAGCGTSSIGTTATSTAGISSAPRDPSRSWCSRPRKVPWQATPASAPAPGPSPDPSRAGPHRPDGPSPRRPRNDPPGRAPARRRPRVCPPRPWPPRRR